MELPALGGGGERRNFLPSCCSLLCCIHYCTLKSRFLGTGLGGGGGAAAENEKSLKAILSSD